MTEKPDKRESPEISSRPAADMQPAGFMGVSVQDSPDWADRIVADNVCFRLYPPVEFEVAYRVRDYVIFTPFARAILDLAVNEGPMRRVAVAAGGALFIPPETQVRARMSAAVEFLVLDVPSARAEPVLDAAADGRIWAPRVLEAFTDPGFAAIQQEIRRTLMGDALVNPAYLAALGDALMARVGCDLAGVEPDAHTRENLSPGVLRRIVTQIEHALDQRITVEDLARDAGLSRSHFSRAFQASTGEPPQEFIIGRRLCRARDMLKDSDRSIADIAVQTGFSSHAHLTTAFKKRLGVTPVRYRASFETPEE